MLIQAPVDAVNDLIHGDQLGTHDLA